MGRPLDREQARKLLEQEYELAEAVFREGAELIVY